jgi:hypothetical protein
MFRLQYSTERISAAIRDMSRIQCALYCKLCAKCSAHPPDFATWIVVPAICSVITAPHIQASIFDWTYLRWYWRYVDNSARYTANLVPIQRTTTSFRNVNCGPGHIQCFYSSTYSRFNIQLNISPPLLEIYRQFHVRYTATLVAIKRTASCLRGVNCGPGHIHCKYISACSDFNIQQNVSPPLFEICREFSAPYTANFVPNAAHILQISLPEL